MNTPLIFSENDTFALADLLATVAKEEPTTYKQREFAARLFVQFNTATKASKPRRDANQVRPDLRPAPMFQRKNKRKR